MTGAHRIEARWWGSTSASVAAHTLLFALLMLIATRVSNISDPPRVLDSPFVFVSDAGSGGGGGGGGDTRVQPPRPALINRAPAATMPTPSETIQPLAPVPMPAVTATAVETLPGVPATIDPSVSPGKGEGPGGGAGRGSGSGSGDGIGIGDGWLAGYGGDVYLPGNGVSNPVLVREVKPNYTADALRAKLQGTVEMEAVVLADGTIDPRSIRIVRSLDPTFGLDREAVEAVKRWRLSPALRNGRPVAVLVTLELAFTLR